MNIFSRVRPAKFKASRYDLSYPTKFTMKAGYIYPVMVEEVIPGDIFNSGFGFVLRTQPLVAPLFTNLYAEMRYFYVPNRLVWNHWDEFIMDQVKGVAQLMKPSCVHPHLIGDDLVDESGIGTLYDFLGNPESNYTEPISALPFRMYNLIWNEYFRDQNLQDPVTVPLIDGMDDPGLYSLLRVNWKKDYFTSALPWTQRGNEVNLPGLVELMLPSGGEQSFGNYQLIRSGVNDGKYGNAGWYKVSGSSANAAGGTLQGINLDSLEDAQGAPAGTFTSEGEQVLTYRQQVSTTQSANINQVAWLDPNGTFGVDINIRDLRFAQAVQRFLEREAAVGGGRYADFIRGMYGVNIGDATLQRPLYLGGGRQAINITPVEQNSATSKQGGDASTPQGNLAGKGFLSSMMSMNRSTLFAEHGYVIGLMYIRPEALYAQGINRHLTKIDRYDYLLPGFERLGEQDIMNKEVCCVAPADPTDLDSVAHAREVNNDSFGYTVRQAEYKQHLGEIHGEFKSSLKQYVLYRDFDYNEAEPPALNSDFIEVNPDMSNILAVDQDVADPFLVDGYNSTKVLRNLQKLPRYGL